MDASTLLSSLLILALASCISAQTCLTSIAPTPPQNVGKILRVSKASWTSAELNAQILGILLREKLGYTVELKYYGANQFQALGEGDVDIILECWLSSNVEEYLKYVVQQKLVEDVGALGVVGQTGWYVPMSTLNQGQYDVFSTFQDAQKAALFAKHPENSTRGLLYASSTAWKNFDDMLVQNLDLKLDVYNMKGEDEMISLIDDAMAKDKPILIYSWTPHPLFSKYRGKLVRVALPFTLEPCQSEDRVQAKTVNCDYPAETLLKLVRADLKKTAPDAYQVVKRLVITNSDQIDLSATVTYDGKSTYEAACKWVKENEARWKTWFEVDDSGDSNDIVVPVVVPIAVAVPTLAVVLCLTITCVCLLRRRNTLRYA